MSPFLCCAIYQSSILTCLFIAAAIAATLRFLFYYKIVIISRNLREIFQLFKKNLYAYKKNYVKILTFVYRYDKIKSLNRGADEH